MDECERDGVVYNFSGRSVSFSPNVDSFPLGQSLTLEAAAPVSFHDQNTNALVKLDASDIEGPLGVIKASGNPQLPTTGAMPNVQFTNVIGSVFKDSIHMSPGQLASYRTAIWQKVSIDSFKFKTSIKPLIRGTYFINLGPQGNRDSECARFKYELTINGNQHLYLLQQLTGSVTLYESNFVYCFKEY